MEIQHFCHQHPLVCNEDQRSVDEGEGIYCWGCLKQNLVQSYYRCIQCPRYFHKSCAESPLMLHHPLHAKHPLVLFDNANYDNDEADRNCELCNERIGLKFCYSCFRCKFNLHSTCAIPPSTMEAEFHNHPLSLVWKWMTFTCDTCGKESKGMPYLCGQCGFWIHERCASYPRIVKVIRHKHTLHLIHCLEVDQSDFSFCHLCVQKVDTDYGVYYCSSCNYVTHLDCAMNKGNREDIVLEVKDMESLRNEGLEVDEVFHSMAYKVKRTYVGEDKTEIVTEIEHFSHEHDLKLIDDEIQSNQKCDGCVRAIIPPFYSCAKCNFFLHKSCIELPRKKRHLLHRHTLTLLPKAPYESKSFWCNACRRSCNGFSYNCETCNFNLDVQCSLISKILTHNGHEHRLRLSKTPYRQDCSVCDSNSSEIFRCTTCGFTLDFKCATLPHTTRYAQHDHPFTLCYSVEDDSNEYYCDICEEKRDPRHWFYCCAYCSFPAHPQCILGESLNYKFGVAYKFDRHQHPLTFIEETKDHPPCSKCDDPCKELIYQCTQCKVNFHTWCL